MDSLALLQSVHEHFAAAELRLPQEKQLQEELEALCLDWGLLTNPPAVVATPPGWGFGEGVRCSEQVFSNLHRLGALARRILRLPRDVEVTLVSSPTACVVWTPSASDEKLSVAVSSAVVERFWVHEALFLIGRAVGMSFLEPARRIVASPWMLSELSERQRFAARALWRCQQIFADRIGLACCQDLAVARRAIVRAECGLPDDLLPTALTEHAAAGELDWRQIYDSPSFLSARIELLNAFYSSPSYRELFLAGKPQTPQPSLIESAATPQPAVVVATPATKEEPAAISQPTPQVSGPDPLEWFEPDECSDPVRDFTACAALWVLSMKDDVTETETSLLVDLFGEETVQLWRLEIETKGESILPEVCRRLSREAAAELDADHRLALIREILSVAMAEGPLSPRENDLVVELASWIGLDEDDLSLLAVEHVDPEFATYRFECNQLVDVQLDGEWVRGSVEAVNPNGDLRVRFLDDGEVFHLNPVSDLVRPILEKQAS